MSDKPTKVAQLIEALKKADPACEVGAGHDGERGRLSRRRRHEDRPPRHHDHDSRAAPRLALTNADTGALHSANA